MLLPLLLYYHCQCEEEHYLKFGMSFFYIFPFAKTIRQSFNLLICTKGDVRSTCIHTMCNLQMSLIQMSHLSLFNA